ncbi:ABC transporter substrate-binding protein [Actinoplanes sp. N902-109]|uniref:ABC transporter substrate-binding protein n=1 Tax=Actinoplanes sp. (strain N902-109) TaxID=649831 RepID=UPI0003295E7F|nr:ABC transporter substrate-binding protein [Actinoplanes sp. N902-109]AGL17591.1 family 5 extracellular solute-binding protein [Actinoplanes sp. N902-109]
MLRRWWSSVVVGALLLGGCSAGGGGADAAAGQPVSGGSLTWGVETEPITFNPHQYQQAKARLLVWNTFEGLLTHDDRGGLVPWLATGYTAARDGLSYTFTLRSGVSFSDGTVLDSAAVRANVEQLLVPGYAPTVAAIQLRNLKGVETPDPHTVVYRLSRPDVLILDFIASPQGAVVSPKSLKEAEDLKAGGPGLAGTGPFVLDRYTAGQQVHFRRNPGYWGPHKAYLDEVTYRFLKEPSVRVGALTSGQVQVIEGVPATDQPLVTGDARLTFAQGLNSGTAYSYFFNVSHAPFDDARVRQAFRDSMDVDTVLKAVYRGTATRAWSVISPTSPFYAKALEGSYGNDPAKANQLLDAAGWSARDAQGFRVKNGKRLTVRMVQSAPFVRDRRDVLAQTVQAAVKQSAGIDLHVAVVDQGTQTQALNDGAYELFDNSRADTDAGAALNLLLPSQGALNRTGVHDAGLDKLLSDAVSTSDTSARRAAYTAVQRKVVADDALVLPLYAPADQIAASRSVGGLRFEPAAGVPGSAYSVWLAR